MKTLTKISVALALAGSLTSVMAATNTQTNGTANTKQTNTKQTNTKQTNTKQTNTKQTNTKQTNTKQTNNNKQTLSIKAKITAIEHASLKDRVKLVNAFKEKIQAMPPEIKQQAMQMYAHAINNMQGQMQNGMNQVQGAMQTQGAMQGQMSQSQGATQTQGAMQGQMSQSQGAMQTQGAMQGQINNKSFMEH